MTMSPPPSRYRVVEDGRTLVVIDRWASARPASVNAPPSSPSVPAPPPRGSITGAATRVRFDGGSILSTHRWYDANGPRTITLDPARAAAWSRAKLILLGLGLGSILVTVAYPWAPLPILFLLLQPKARAAARGAITRWLDRAAAGA